MRTPGAFWIKMGKTSYRTEQTSNCWVHIPILKGACHFIKLTPCMWCLVMTKRVRGEQKLKGGDAYLSISPNCASAVTEQLWHVIVTCELPQTSLQVEVPVEPQGTGPPKGSAVLVWRCLADHLWIFGGFSKEAIASLNLSVVQQIGAAMVANTGTIRTQRELKVRQGPGGHYRQHSWGRMQKYSHGGNV